MRRSTKQSERQGTGTLRRMLRRALSGACFAGVLVFAAGCSSEPTGFSGRFLDGTTDEPEIGLVVNSLGKSLTMFQLGHPSERREIPFGTSGLITPVGLSVRGTQAVVPLGDAASVALVDLEHETVTRNYLFLSGNTTGSVFVDDHTFLVANTLGGYVGRATDYQLTDAITETADVAPAPTAIVMADEHAFVISSNYDDSYVPLGNGIVTMIYPATMTVIDTVSSGGLNSSAAALGPDGKLYVLNTGDYVGDASVTIIDPTTLEVEATIPGFPTGAGSLRIDEDGLMYVSSYAGGTVVWNTVTGDFVRGMDNPLCGDTPCPGAFDAVRADNHALYQLFFGSSEMPATVFVYAPETYALTGSVVIGAGAGSTSLDIARFR